MSSNSSSRRCSKRNVRASNRRIDLNSPPAPSPPALSPQAAAASGGGLVNSPIDLEASDDEIQLLSSPRGFPQARNQSRRRNGSVIVVVDEEREIRSGPSGVPVNDPVTVSCFNRPNKRQRIPPNKTIINCESYSISGDDLTAKRNKVSKPVPEKVVPKEPTFSCPICMSTLVVPCSTVCGHIFCEGCIKSAIQAQKKCPTCRSKLTARNFHKVFLPTAAAD